MPIAVPPQLKRVPSVQRLPSTLSQLLFPEHEPLSINPETHRIRLTLMCIGRIAERASPPTGAGPMAEQKKPQDNRDKQPCELDQGQLEQAAGGRKAGGGQQEYDVSKPAGSTG
jgi:hypothetical protein